MKRISPLITLVLAVSLFISCGDSPSGPEALPTPSVLIVDFTGDTLCQVTATWTICPDANFEAYSLYRSHLPGIAANPDTAEVLVVYTDADQRTYIDEDLDWDFTYYYAVRTGNSENQYSWSNEITMHTPDDPVIPPVRNLAFSPLCNGQSIVLYWSSLPNAEGYKIYFRETFDGAWEEVGDVTTTTFTHIASVAGYYSVRAYNGVNYSEDYSTPVNTIPSIITTVYTIYDNYSPLGFHDGFIFGHTGGMTGQASHPALRKTSTPTTSARATPRFGSSLAAMARSATATQPTWPILMAFTATATRTPRVLGSRRTTSSQRPTVPFSAHFPIRAEISIT